MRGIWFGFFFVLLVASMAPPASYAALWDPFSGHVDLSQYQSEVDGLERDGLRQDYNVAFSQKLSPWVDFRLSYKYFHLDQDFEFDRGVYRKESLPSGDLRWNHPYFTVMTSLQRREVETTFQGGVITNVFTAGAKTISQRHPQFEIRYDEQHSYFEELSSQRDIRNKRFLIGASWNITNHILNYRFNHDKTENVVSDQTSVSDKHSFMWSGYGQATEKLRLAGSYNYSHVDLTTVNNKGGVTLRPLPIAIGIYAQTDSPDLVTLVPRPGLADGNTDAPVQPEIDIGGSNNRHNLGGDLGGAREIGGIHLYTDGPSGELVNWEVWISDDNNRWTRYEAFPQQVFNSALTRYEIRFDGVVARFIKIVNTGLNDIPRVLVTELEAFELISEESQSNLQALSHRIDGRADYRFTEKLVASLDVAFLAEENPGRGGDRSNGSVGVRANYRGSPSVSHNILLQVSNQWNGALGDDFTESYASYALALIPLETLRASASLNNRYLWLAGERNRHIRGGGVEGGLDLLHGLVWTLGGTYNRSDDFLVGLEYNSWSLRTGIEASLRKSFDLTLDWGQNETFESVGEDLQVRQSWGVGFDWRLTQDLFARFSRRVRSELSDSLNLEFLVSWNILPSLRISAQHFEYATNDRVTSMRRNANLNWELTKQANLYLRLSMVDLSGSGGIRTTSFQQGFRLSF